MPRCARSASGPGDRVATLCWNQQEHLDLYFGVPMMGAILHPLNARLSADQLAAILEDAGSRVLVADHSLLPLLARSASGRRSRP